MSAEEPIVGEISSSGTATPVLITSTSVAPLKEVFDDDADVYVEPGSVVEATTSLPTNDSLMISAELHISDEDITVPSLDADISFMSTNLTVLCKKIVQDSISQFATVKSQLIREKNAIIRDMEARYYTDMQMQEDKINALKQEMAAMKLTCEENTKRQERIQDHSTSIMLKKHMRLQQLLVEKHCFHVWVQHTGEEKHRQRLESLANIVYRKQLQRRMFGAWQVEAHRMHTLRIARDTKMQRDQATKEVIENYELRIQNLMRELHETRKLLHEESEARKTFETDLKRVFLKNLTAMNMEAYALFQHPAVPETVPDSSGAKEGSETVTGSGTTTTIPRSTSPNWIPASMFRSNLPSTQTTAKRVSPSTRPPAAPVKPPASVTASWESYPRVQPPPRPQRAPGTAKRL